MKSISPFFVKLISSVFHLSALNIHLLEFCCCFEEWLLYNKMHVYKLMHILQRKVCLMCSLHSLVQSRYEHWIFYYFLGFICVYTQCLYLLLCCCLQFLYQWQYVLLLVIKFMFNLRKNMVKEFKRHKVLVCDCQLVKRLAFLKLSFLGQVKLFHFV
jgi:hypothetical protein